MKGFLKGSDGGVFHLLPKVTTIGREGCNLAIQSASVDNQHAVIELNEQKDWFVLQDLDTTHGTSVNKCRIQNVAVRLSPGDVIKFGSHPTTFEFNISSQTSMVRPSAYPRAAWSSSCSKVMETASTLPGKKISLPNCPNGISTPLLWSAAGDDGSTAANISPHPPTSTKTRPLIAGIRRNSLDVTSPVVHLQSPIDSEVRLATTANSLSKTGSQLDQLQQHLKVLTEELKHIAGIEMSARQKDELISQLKDEIATLQKRLRQVEVGIVDTGSSDFRQKLAQLEKELVRGQLETKSLKSQLNQIKPPVSVTMSPYHVNCTTPLANNTSASARARSQIGKPKQMVANSEPELTDVNRLQMEIDHLKKDRNVTLGLLSQLQKDMANKDVSISHLTKQIEELKKELSVKDCHISSLKSKVQHTDQPKKDADGMEFKDREMALLQYKLKVSENQRLEITDQLASAKKDLAEAKTASEKDKQKTNLAKSESETLKTKYQDMERAERLVRVAMEQVSKKLELLRSQVIQMAYSSPGAKVPDKHMDDDEILAMLKGYINQFDGLLKRNQLLETKQDIENTIAENTRRLKKEFVDSALRLKSKGQQSRHLQEEIDRIKAISVTETFLSDVRDAFLMLLQIRVNWEKDTENALEKSGVGLTLLSDVPSKCITDLHSKLQEALAEEKNLKTRLEEAESRYKDQIDAALNRLQTDLENKHKDDIEQIKHEGELRLVCAVNEARRRNEDSEAGAVDMEKQKNVVDMEKQKNVELEQKVELLKQSLKERENNYELLRAHAQTANESLELFRKTEANLRENIKKLESDQSDRVNQLATELKECREELKERVKERDEISEQAKQHISMICALEERMNVAVNKNKENQMEIGRLVATITELEGKLAKPQSPSPESKPLFRPPVAEEAAMEQLLQDNKELSRHLQDQQNIIVALRRDLAGAQARLSDVTAELSDAQKMALEKGNKKIQAQEAELTQLQQKMARLSEIVDKQTIEIKDLKSSLSKEKEVASQYKKELGKKNADISMLQKVNDQKRTTSEDSKESKEDKVISELRSIGAQCKGELHLQVIERQREALVELRAQLKVLSGGAAAEPKASNVDHALQQVLVLQKEFEDLRASQAPPPSVAAPKDEELTVVNRVVNQARGVDFASRAQLDMERSAHLETQRSLEHSEQLYMALVRRLLEILNIENCTNLKSLTHLSLEESQHLADEREKIHEMIADQIEALNKRLERKDELLRGYDGGLLQIREAQDFASINSQRAESMNDEVQVLKEEIRCLQETLGRMREQLEKEKRLNAYIKQKKTFHLEREFTLKNGWPRHYCLQEDPMTKSKKKSFRADSPKKMEMKSLKLEGSKFKSMQANDDFKLIAVDT